jgi:outer membrane protein assembly factor BamB
VYYAFDLATGAIRWQHDFKQDIGQATFHGDPLVTDTLVVTGTEALSPTHARAFDRRSGRTVWTQTGAWALTLSDVLGLGRLAVGRNGDGELIALDAASGTPVWRVPHQGRRFQPHVAESPAAVDDDVAFSAPDGAIYRADGASGAVLWRTEIGCDASTSVTADGDRLYVGCADGALYWLDTETGAIQARLNLGQPLEGRLLPLADRLIVPAGTGWIGAVDRELARVLWARTDLPRLSVVHPLRWGDDVLTGTEGGLLVALAAADGRTSWTMPLEGSLRGLGHADGILLVGTIQGRITALRVRP